MTSSYRRSYQRSGRFKPFDAGDLGLRAYKNQQDQLIANDKQQQLRAGQYGDQLVTEMQGAQNRELAHQLELQQLETRAYETRRRAIEKRGQTEYDKWMGEAKKYEKESAFWGKFSTTYAANFARLAEGATTYAGVAQAEQYFNDLRKSGLLDLSKDRPDLHQTMTNKLNRSIIDDASEQKLRGEHYNVQKLLKIPFLAKPYVAKRFLTYTKNHATDIRMLVQSEATKLGEDGKPANQALYDKWKENPDEVISNFVLNSAQSWGLDVNNREVFQAVDHIVTQQYSAGLQEKLGIESKERDTNFHQSIEGLDAAFKAYNEDPSDENLEALQNAWDLSKLHAGNRILKSRNGTYSIPLPNDNIRHSQVKPTLEALVELGEFDDFADIETLYTTLVPEKFRSNEDLRELEELNRKRIKKENQNAATDKTGKEIAEEKEAIKYLQNNPQLDQHDYTAGGDRQDIHNRAKACTGEKCKKIYNTWLLADQLHKGTEINYDGNFGYRERLREAYQNGDMELFNNLFLHATEEQKKGFETATEELQQLSRTLLPNGLPFSPKNLQKYAKTITDTEAEKFSISGIKNEHPTQLNATSAYITTFNSHYQRTANDPSLTTPRQRIEKAIALTREDMDSKGDEDGIKGRGLFRRMLPNHPENDSGQTIWLAYHVEPEGQNSYKKLLTSSGISQHIKNNNGSWDSLIENNRIISNDELDSVLLSSKQGDPLVPTANVKTLVNEWNKRAPAKDVITYSDVYNKILEQKGLTNFTLQPSKIETSREFIQSTVEILHGTSLPLNVLNRLSDTSITRLVGGLAQQLAEARTEAKKESVKDNKTPPYSKRWRGD